MYKTSIFFPLEIVYEYSTNFGPPGITTTPAKYLRPHAPRRPTLDCAECFAAAKSARSQSNLFPELAVSEVLEIWAHCQDKDSGSICDYINSSPNPSRPYIRQLLFFHAGLVGYVNFQRPPLKNLCRQASLENSDEGFF